MDVLQTFLRTFTILGGQGQGRVIRHGCRVKSSGIDLFPACCVQGRYLLEPTGCPEQLGSTSGEVAA